MTHGLPAGDENDVFDQLGEALERQQGGTDRHGELDRPVLHAPFGERMLTDIDGVHREAHAGPEHRDDENEEEEVTEALVYL